MSLYAWILGLARRIGPRSCVALTTSVFAVFAGGNALAQDLAQWLQTASTGPSARYMASMAYDRGRGKTILFGGYESDDKLLSDTWEWDGSSWNKAAATGPSARYFASMAHDTARDRTVLFGGLNLDGFLSDTWEWDGSGWKLLAGTGPSARDCASMAYDSVRGRTVLFGGWNVNATKFLSDTWEWDGSAWKPVAGTGPSARCVACMAFDGARGRMVLFGGYYYDTDYDPHYCGDTWEWDGSAWKQVAATGPPARSDACLAYDSARGRTVVFGGYDWYNFYADTWEYNASHVFTNQDAVSALRIAGGISSAGRNALSALDVVKSGMSAGCVDIADAVRIARKVAGLEANP